MKLVERDYIYRKNASTACRVHIASPFCPSEQKKRARKDVPVSIVGRHANHVRDASVQGAVLLVGQRVAVANDKRRHAGADRGAVQNVGPAESSEAALVPLNEVTLQVEGIVSLSSVHKTAWCT